MTLPPNSYDPGSIEPRWQRAWDEQRTFRALNPGVPGFDPAQPKFYVLDMFPYPSGAGLHVGHPIGYIGTDIVARRKRMEGCNVLHPMGWDAFGLPAEQYAIQTGKHPSETTRANIANFKRQIRLIGLSYDWTREISTCEPAYYKWTQWIFKRLYERGLAYQAEVAVWWCEELKTVLSNEEVVNGRSERGDHPCVKRPLKQWMLRITAYADRLHDDLDLVDWPQSLKTMQREWIGRSHGAEIRFAVEALPGQALTVFTTRPDTLFGATFMVLAPEHALLKLLPESPGRSAVESYVRQAATRSELERAETAKDKTGVFTGLYAINPAFVPGDAGCRIPIWVADYVLASYGSGAIMAVPGQDQRDWDFAAKFGLRIVRTVDPPADWQGQAWTGTGPAINSNWLDGLEVEQATQRTIAWLEERGIGRAKTVYKLRDWLFSRQRYWGEPFPLLRLEDGRSVPVEDGELPVELPAMDDFKPSSDGSAPLARAREWLETRHAPTGQRARRETDTMPGWAGSCWYWLRFMDPANARAFVGPEAERYWGQVDLYVGGAEHAVLHLLYARFWHKVLHDLGLVSTPEPFKRLFNQGLLTAYAYQDASGRLVAVDEVEERDGGCVLKSSGAQVQRIVAKMSKSLKNVVNPDDIIAEQGADTLRLYEMFMGPLSDSKPWNPRDIAGCRRFLDRLWRLLVDVDGSEPIRAQFRAEEPQPELAGETLRLERELHRTIKRIDDSFEGLNLNTSVSALMSFLNEAQKAPQNLQRDQVERVVLCLSPFAPHVAEELWSRLGHTRSLAREAWPRVDARYLADDRVEYAVQVNGKLRGKVVVAADAAKDIVVAAAAEAVRAQLDGKERVKDIYVPGKLVNFVVR